MANAIGVEPERVFKTLVTRNEKNGIFVFCVPGNLELNLKKSAKITGSKKIDLIPVKELLSLTGYIRGGCSPLGMKKHYPLWIDETCELFKKILISAGVRGSQIEALVSDLIQITGASTADLT